jgi:hypothetical protein
VQCQLDPRDGAWCDLFEAARVADFVDDFAQESLRIVLLAEERPIQRVEPALPLGVSHHDQSTHQTVGPPARPQNVDQRLVGVQQDVEDQNAGE